MVNCDMDVFFHDRFIESIWYLQRRFFKIFVILFYIKVQRKVLREIF